MNHDIKRFLYIMLFTFIIITHSEEKTVSRAKSASEKLPQSRRTLPASSQKSQPVETESSMDDQVSVNLGKSEIN